MNLLTGFLRVALLTDSGSAGGRLSIEKSTRPAATSVSALTLPLYVTCTSFIPATTPSIAPPRRGALPTSSNAKVRCPVVSYMCLTRAASCSSRR